MGLSSGSAGKEFNCNKGDTIGTGLITGLGRSHRKGNGNLLQYSCLENAMDKEAWQATVHAMAKSQIQLFTWHTPRIEWKPEVIKDMVKTAKYPYGEQKETREMKIWMWKITMKCAGVGGGSNWICICHAAVWLSSLCLAPCLLLAIIIYQVSLWAMRFINKHPVFPSEY